MIFTDTTVSLIGFYASKEVKTWKMCFVFFVFPSDYLNTTHSEINNLYVAVMCSISILS